MLGSQSIPMPTKPTSVGFTSSISARRLSSKSVEYFRKAIATDPGFAPAYAGLAESLPARNWFNGKPPVDVMPEARAAAKRALELDDRLAEAHTALGALLSLYFTIGIGAKQKKNLSAL